MEIWLILSETRSNLEKIYKKDLKSLREILRYSLSNISYISFINRDISFINRERIFRESEYRRT
jgi:hypothetical protein